MSKVLSSTLNNLIQISLEVGSNLINYKKNNKIKSNWIGDQLKKNADIYANEFWIKRLKQKFSNFDLISEEDNSSQIKLTNNFNGFILDPIDGTRSYVDNFKSYVTQVAHIINGQIFSSVFY
jgi:fructose-1,6-bisphosphatase/inositol monophosphatase family enzyme